MKLLVGFFLSLSILLFNAYGQPYRAGYAGFGALHKAKHASLMRHAPSGPRRGNFKVYATDKEEEDNEPGSKRYLEISSYFTVPDVHLTGYFCSYIKQCLAFCKLFSYFPSHRYLIFLVIRR